MPKKSEPSSIIRKSADEVPAATAASLDRLRSVMERPIDTSEIPEKEGAFHRLKRDATGRLPVRKSLIRDTIARELQRNQISTYRLWKTAKEHCPTLSQSAVYEFMKGQRQLELPYAEALMRAVHLGVLRIRVRKKSETGTSRKRSAIKRN